MSKVAISQSAPQDFSRARNTKSDNNTTVPQVVPATIGGTVYYLTPSSGPNLVGDAMPTNVSSTAPLTVGGPKAVPAVSIATPRMAPTAFTTQKLAQLLVSSKKGHQPEWKLAEYNGDPLQRHNWFGQINITDDSTPLADDVTLTNWKT